MSSCEVKRFHRTAFRRCVAAVCAALVLAGAATAAELPDGYWPLERSQPLLDQTARIELAPDLSHLAAGERAAVGRLLAAGRLLHDLYERQQHVQAAEALTELRALHAREPSPATDNLLTLYRVFKGPVATTLDNERVPFLPVADEIPGRNVYPVDVSRQALDAFLDARPGVRAQLLGERTVVRTANAQNIGWDLDTLDAYPLLDGLHPGLRERIAAAGDAGEPFYAVPYSVAYADTLLDAAALVGEASELVAATDPDLSAYLRLRARDLLTDDYEAGDAAWVLGSFDNLNAQIGSYETYDDELYGAKAFYSLSILVRDRERTAALDDALASIQAIEDALPYAQHKKIRPDIPVGVYEVVADFGQARGVNTATILPNDADHARKYGRTILMRRNLMTAPAVAQQNLARFRAATATEFHDDLTPDGDFERVLWHEIGHYLGVAKTRDGRHLPDALQAYASLLEEMKADLVSLFAARILERAGHRDEATVRAIYASGIGRFLWPVRPRPEQPYGMMQLMQWNYYLEHGLLEYDAERGLLSIDYGAYHDVIGSLLREVLELQAAGDAAAAAAFVARWAYWDDDLHGMIAGKVRDAMSYRYTLVHYRLLDGET